MSGESCGVPRVPDLGFVEAVNEPEGVSWLTFGSLYLEGYEGTEEIPRDDTLFDIVPVSTTDLAAAKGSEPQVDDAFWAEINDTATSQADVYPRGFKYSPLDSE